VPTNDKCEYCGSRNLFLNFNKNNIPASLEGNPEYVGCIYCDELISELSGEGQELVIFYLGLIHYLASVHLNMQCSNVDEEEVEVNVVEEVVEEEAEDEETTNVANLLNQ
jgi:hypothetical protein